MKTWIALALAGLLSSAATAATPFAANLKGLKVLVMDVNGSQAEAKKAGLPFDAIYKLMQAKLQKAGLKVVRSGKDVPEGKRALAGELMLGITTHNGLYSYALTLQAYEPLRFDNKDHLYVAWSSLTYGFSPQASIKAQLKEQVDGLLSTFVADYKKAN
jgi:hypothetical protein